MILLDTSAIYALADEGDSNHHRAVDLFQHALETSEDILVHSYVLVEAAALLQRRLSLDSSLRFLRDSDAFQIHWIETRDHKEAIALLEERGRRGLSLVDCASFVVMRRYNVQKALAFDPDFEGEGFALYV